MKVEGNKIRLSFKKGTYDFAKVSELKGFAIKNTDGNWTWAKAKAEGEKIVVWNDSVKNPVAVRYDWADNPDGNLKNKSGLPASSFTTE
jgi:sialate O-acetylesterase